MVSVPELVKRKKQMLKPTELQTKDAPRYIRLAGALAESGDYEGAEAAAVVATQCDPSKFEAWMMLAMCCAKRKHYTEAAAAYERAVALKHDDVAAWASLGELYVGLNRYQDSANALRRACELDPEGAHPSGRRARAVIGRTIASLRR